jgi:hypothetical protein
MNEVKQKCKTVMTSTWIVKNKNLEHINTEGEGRGNEKYTDKLTIMQVLDQEYCNLSVERVALHRTGSASAAEA